MSSTALVLNILVAGISCATYVRAGFLSGKLTWPFVAASVPAAFIGGLMQVSDRAYQIMLALVLVIAAARLGLVLPERQNSSERTELHVGLALLVGAALGAISGTIGVGGGIFLSPLMILMNWAGTKQTAATSACFIVVNSAAGLMGRAMRQGIEVGSLLPLVVAAAIGGFAGSYLGAKRLSGLNLRRLLAIVLVIAAVKLILTAPHKMPVSSKEYGHLLETAQGERMLELQLFCCQADVWQLLEQGADGNLSLQASKRCAQAEMDPFAEGNVLVGTAPDVQLVRIRENLGIAVAGTEQDNQHIVFGNLLPAQLHVLSSDPPHELNRRFVAQELLDG
jgi:hypothetical protein